MSLPLAAIWRISRRDLSARIRGLRLLAICLFLGVATLAAIGSLTAGISDELSRRGQTILGGDIEIGIAQRVANAADVESDAKQTLAISFRLDLTQLPRPLQIGAAGQSDWNISLSKTQRLVLEPLR